MCDAAQNGAKISDEEKSLGAPDVFTAASTDEVKAALQELRQRERSVQSKLDLLVASQHDLKRELGRLDLFRANLSTQASRLRTINHGMVSNAVVTAGRLSNSVKQLDLQQSRVKSTVTVIEQVRELKACVLGVTGSMGAAQDWETAASYLSRASQLPKEVVEGAFAARVVPTVEVPDVPTVTLNNASESLCGLFLREFDKAVKDNDGPRVTRFFKLFPMINRSEVGLDVYGRYVCQGVATRARSNLNAGTGGNQSKDALFFANALTKLFEHIAQIVDGHGGLVSRHYGNGSMTRVIERLQVEADMQGGILLDTWSDERRIDRQLTDIKSYAYTFLVQSFLPVQRGSTGTPRSSSPAKQPARNSEDEGVDMKNVDANLNEMTMMLGKWALYTRFVAAKSAADPSEDVEDDKNIVIPQFMVNSTLSRKIHDRVINSFNIMTTFFFRRSVEKAFQLDEQPSDLSLNPHKPISSDPPHTTSAVDDVLYILNKVVQQTLATSQSTVVFSVIPSLARVMTGDFLGMIQRKMRDESYPRAAIQGQLPPEHTIVSFLVLMNNLDIARDYVDQLLRTQIAPGTGTSKPSFRNLFPGSDVVQVTKTLKSFQSSFTEKTTELINEGVHVIFGNVFKPRLRPILLDAFRDTDYQSHPDVELDAAIDDDEDVNTAEIVRRRFQHGWDALTKPIGRIMTEGTFEQLLTTIVTYLSKLLEKRLWTYQGRVDEAGAIRLERDVNGIIQTVIQNKKYIYREAFLRCTQICMIMSMDDEEWEAVQHSGGEIADKLTLEEKVRARNLVAEGDL